ncbi:MAG: hypothetical protein ACTSR7_16465 [Promethearchaeota archaeon]
MKLNQVKRMKFLLLILVILFTSFNVFGYRYFDSTQEAKGLHLSSQELVSEEWLKNSDFNTTDNWMVFKGDLGDQSDVAGNLSQNQGDSYIIGDHGTFEISDALNSTDWIAFQNPSLPILPDDYGINGSGAYVSHTWHEGIDQTRNSPSIQWKRNVTMPINMSDYIITSASLSCIFNASVQALDHDGGGIEVNGDYTEGFVPGVDTQFGIGDFVTFYSTISDLENTFPFEIASNRTSNLGQDSPTITNHTDTLMNVVLEDILIAYLTSALATDDYNFTITLGIDIYSEDNEYNVDIDRYRALIIKSFNLTFSYEKKIDRFTTIGFSQVSNQISGENVHITNANLKFKYKLDQNWTSESTNSEIRMLINDNFIDHDSIKLRNYIYSTDFIEANIDGFDVTALILKDVNISLTIQTYILDTFGLGDGIKLSFDDIYLRISYIIFTPDETDEPWQSLGWAIVISTLAVGLLGYLIAYQRVLKYPIPVRKVRKYNKTLNESENPKIPILPRDKAFKRKHGNYLKKTEKILKGASPKQKSIPDKLVKQKPETSTVKPVDSLTEKPLNKKE